MTKSPIDEAIDRRVQRTRIALRHALIELITEQGWDDFTVQDVCERANIGRTTFYLHYPNKDALLQGGLGELQTELRRQTRERSAAAGANGEALKGFGFAVGLIEHAIEQRTLFRGLIGRRSGYVVQQRFREMVIRLVEEELPTSVGALPNEAVARWLAGAFVELLSWWVEQQTPIPPQELAALFNELSRPALEQPRRTT